MHAGLGVVPAVVGRGRLKGARTSFRWRRPVEFAAAELAGGSLLLLHRIAQHVSNSAPTFTHDAIAARRRFSSRAAFSSLVIVECF
jgi:hypothetical protein